VDPTPGPVPVLLGPPPLSRLLMLAFMDTRVETITV
jgi:hypothetical protein